MGFVNVYFYINWIQEQIIQIRQITDGTFIIKCYIIKLDISMETEEQIDTLEYRKLILKQCKFWLYRCSLHTTTFTAIFRKIRSHKSVDKHHENSKFRKEFSGRMLEKEQCYTSTDVQQKLKYVWYCYTIIFIITFNEDKISTI